MKIDDMRMLGIEEMKKNLNEAHEELFNLRFRLSTRQLLNHRELAKVKKRIAQLNTILKEKELGLR